MSLTPPVATVLHATRLRCTGANGTLFDLPNLTISPGLTCVQGGERRGKTTLLRLLAGELPQQVDSMVLDGIDLHSQAASYHRAVAWFDPRTEAHDAQSCAATRKRSSGSRLNGYLMTHSVRVKSGLHRTGIHAVGQCQ